MSTLSRFAAPLVTAALILPAAGCASKNKLKDDRRAEEAALAVALGFPLLVWLFDLTATQAGMAAAITGLYFLVATVPLISLYVARTYKNVVHRPLYVIDQTRSRL